jgi:hypothetical protein
MARCAIRRAPRAKAGTHRKVIREVHAHRTHSGAANRGLHQAVVRRLHLRRRARGERDCRVPRDGDVADESALALAIRRHIGPAAAKIDPGGSAGDDASCHMVAENGGLHARRSNVAVRAKLASAAAGRLPLVAGHGHC